MQKIKRYLIAGAIFLAVSKPGTGSGDAWAEECDYLQLQIQKEHNFIKRRALFRQAVTVCPENALLHFQFGHELERARKYDEALAQYATALQLDTNMAKAHFNMGDIYLSQEQYSAAIKSYSDGLKIEPDNPRVQKNLARALQKSNEQ